MSEIKKDDIVRCWPGTRNGRSYPAQVISDGVVEFGSSDCYRVRGIEGGTDYLAVTHVDLIGRAEGRTVYVPTGHEALEVCDFDFETVVIEDPIESLKMARIMKGFR